MNLRTTRAGLVAGLTTLMLVLSTAPATAQVAIGPLDDVQEHADALAAPGHGFVDDATSAAEVARSETTTIADRTVTYVDETSASPFAVENNAFRTVNHLGKVLEGLRTVRLAFLGATETFADGMADGMDALTTTLVEPVLDLIEV